jgi:hypothetical protein
MSSYIVYVVGSTWGLSPFSVRLCVAFLSYSEQLATMSENGDEDTGVDDSEAAAPEERADAPAEDDASSAGSAPEDAPAPAEELLAGLPEIRRAVDGLDDDALSALADATGHVSHEVTTGDIIGYVLSGVGIGLSVADSGDDDETSTDRPRFDPPEVRIAPESDVDAFDFNEPEEGTVDWHVPLNENFGLLNENPPPLVVDTVAELRTHEATDERLALVRETADLYVGDGAAWDLVGRLDYTRRLSTVEDRLADIEQRVEAIHDAVRADGDDGADDA